MSGAAHSSGGPFGSPWRSRVEDVTLPEPDADDQWCELLIHTATPEVGKQWTTPARSTSNAT
ncbi:hypothetical protein [Streptomyces sp. NPDC057413]|uniref:hypothetical protein n=1 Tax=Streptomyces sp. NPDC057413 TaxID=3346124 RepID=UPI0036C684F8